MAKNMDTMFSVAFFFFILLAMVAICCCSTCHPEERSGLTHFKQGLDDSYDQLESWSGLDCCSWEGITCDLHSGHVVRMDFTSFGYGVSVRNSSSHIFHGLLQLQHLEYLDLDGIYFHPLGIPSELAMLHTLTHLSLRDCSFTGRIPNDMGNMSGLKFLDFSGNDGLESWQLGEWIGNLRGLEYLALSAVNLTRGGDRVVQNIAASLTNLTTLDMSGCGVSGTTILSPLANLTSLSDLDLSVNDFTHQPFPNWISNLTSLVSLSLYACDLQGPLLSLPPHLRRLDLSRNPDFKENISNILQHASKLSTLDILRSNVGGVIPNSIGNMSSLTVLNLRDNNIESIIPPSIGNVSSLSQLDLSRNSLSSSIPWTSLGGLSKLSTLILRSNQLNGSLPSTFGNLSSLLHLDLGHNSLSGIIPPSLQYLSSLQRLYLDHNKFHGTFLLSLLANFTKITHLFLSSNNFLCVKVNGYWIPKFQLQYLYLTSCNMEGDFPLFISTQYVIEYLDLSNNNFSGDIPNWLWDLTFLYYLNLSSNQFGGSPLSSKFSEFNVQYIDLHANKLQGSVYVPHLNVEFLDLSENLFDRFIPADIGKYGQGLRFLSLAKNNLSGGIPHSICEGYLLEVLDMSNNKFAGNILKTFGNCSSTLKVLNLENNLLEGEIKSMACLQTLKLGGNRVKGQIPSSLQNCSSLEILDLGYNGMQGKIPNWIGKLTGLKILVLRSNKFEGVIPLQLAKLQNLQVLILSNNNFSGVIPRNFGNLRAMANRSQSVEVLQYLVSTENYLEKMVIHTKGQDLEYVRSLALVRCLDLSDNNLSGDIPQEIGFLIGLVALNVSRNHFAGKIPNSFKNLVLLESLDLSRNNLIGAIPTELILLTFLSYLNVSYNNLSGRIPQGAQMSTFDASSFSHNIDLCGLQLNISCSSSSVSPKSIDDDEDGIEEELEEHIWWEVGLGLSFGFGFAVVIGVLCFKEKYRCKCFKLMDDIIVIMDEMVREFFS